MSAYKKVSRSRRTFLAAVPAAVAGAIATDAWARQPAPPQPAGPLTADMLRAAEAIDGVKFTAEEEQAADAGCAIAAGRYNGPLHGGVRIRPHSPSWVVPCPRLDRTCHVLPTF